MNSNGKGNSRRFFLVFFLLLIAQPLYATSTLQSVFESYYSDSDSTQTADCQTCHASSTTRLNAYGKSLCDQLTDEVTGTDRVLSFLTRVAATEGLDSDGDGSSNLEEIDASAQPGWTSGDANPVYRKVFNANECVATGTFEEAPWWVQNGDLDPLPAGNIAPVAVADSDSTALETPVTIDVLNNDVDGNGDALEVSSVITGDNTFGVVTNNVSDLTYTPENDFCGTAIFQYQATDGSVGSNFATVTVSVGDGDAPDLEAPDDNLEVFIPAGSSQISASSPEVASWLASASAEDEVEGNIPVTVNAPAVFEAGTTTVVFSAIDSCGNTSVATADITVTVESNNEPNVSIPFPNPLALTAPLCAVSVPNTHPDIVDWLALASADDVEDGNLAVTNNAPAAFPLGNTAVEFRAVDSLGASGEESATVMVIETPNLPPVIDSPSPISISVSASTTSVTVSDGEIQAFLSSVSASDAEDGTLIVTHDAPLEFPLGATTVTFQTTDECGVSRTSQSTVTIIADLTNNPPSIVGPTPMSFDSELCATSVPVGDALIASFFDAAVATDDEDGDISSFIVNDAPSALPVTTFPGTQTVVTFSITDSGEPAGVPMTSTTTSRITLTDPNTGPTLVPPAAITLATPNVSVPDSDPTIAAFLASAQAQDQQDGEIAFSNDAPSLFEPGTTEVIFSAVDACGVSVSRSSTVTIPVDSTGPVITLLGDNPMDVGQFSSFNDPGATAVDEFDGDVTAYIFTSGDVDTNVIGTYFVNYDVSDASGNAADTVTRVVNVMDSTPPVISLIGNSPLEVEQGTTYNDAGVTATDNIDGDLTGSIVISNTVNTSIVGTYTVTYDVTDAAGNAAETVIRTIFVVPPDTAAPVIALLGDNPLNLEQNIVYLEPGATAFDDVDGDISGNIVISGTVDHLTVGTYTISYDVTDEAGNSATTVTRTVNVTPRPDTTAPVITLLGDNPMEVELNTLFTDPGATASDETDGDISDNIVVTSSVSTLIAGTYEIYYNVSDAAGNAAATVTRIVNVVLPPDTTAPVITLVGTDPIEVEQDTPFVDPGAIAIDDVDGDISADIITTGSVDTSVIGSYTLTYDVSDAAGNAAITVTRIVNVVVPPDTVVPVITLLGTDPFEVEQNETFVDPGAVANDDVDGNISASIVATGVVNTAVLGNYTRSYNVSDAAGNAAVTVTRTVIVIPPVDDTPPVITLLGDNPMEVAQNASFVDPGATANDDFDGDVSSSIAASGTVNTAVLGSYTRTYSVSDAAGNSAEVTRIVNVVVPPDTTPPVITLLGANPMEVEIGTTFTDPGASALDDTDGDLTAGIVASGVVNTSVLGSYTRVYTVSDAAGNSQTVTRTVTVVNPADTIAPIITLLGSNPMEIEQNTPFNDPGATAVDNIDGDVTALIAASGIVNTAVVGSYTRSYNVTDTAGNAAVTVTRTVNVVPPADVIPPVITLLGSNPLNVEQNTPFVDPGVTAIDNIDGNISANVVVSGTVNTAVIGSYVITYNVSDAAGNAAVTVNRTVVVTPPADTTAPVITLIGSNPLNIDQNTVFNDPGATASDNIDGDISGSIVATGLVNTAVPGTYIRSYNVSDAAGNAAVTVTRIINVSAPVDTTPPVISLLGSNPINIEQNSTFTDPGATALDNVDGNISSSIVASGTVNTAVVGSYIRSYNVTDAAGNAAATVTRIVNVQPDAAPIITLSGNNPVEIFVGGSYVEPGYFATDNVDGNLTASVIVDTSAVNTNVVGSYAVTYNVTDSVGNAALTATRTVNVISTTSTYTANPNLSVGAASVSTTLFVPDDRQISDLNVFIDMDHDYPGDVTIILTSPSGTSVTIVDGPGRPASTWGCSRDDFRVTLDDEGSGSVENACSSSSPAIGGTLTPNNPLSVFDGESSQGTWTLQLDDFYPQADGGTLNTWSLIITAAPVSAPDLVAPVISLLGDNPLEIPVGGSYSEPGYSATDNVDGDISGAVSVDTSAINANAAGSYMVTYNVSDSAGNSATAARWVNVTSGPDTTAPVISLSGSNPVDLSQGSPYVDPGYSAVDNVDGDITSSVVVDISAININVLGSYVVTYNVSDSVGNAAATVTRTVNVIEEVDTTPPVITLLGANPIEILQGGTYSEPGYSASDDFDGNITSNVSVNSNSVNTGVIGSYTVTYNVSDSAGNSAATATRTVNVVSPTSTYTANPGLAVGAASVSTTLFVPDDRQIADLNVFIDMPHAYPGDVTIVLTSPAGTSVTIVDRPGVPSSTWGCSRDDFLVTLDDEGSGSVENACASSSPAIGGTLTPNNPLSAFDGESSQGTWTLRLDDAYTQADTGTLDTWRLIITAEEITPPDPQQDTTAPVISLIGNAVIDHPNGTPFSDPGATAIDNVDGNITANITVSGSVNVNSNGTYLLTYNVQDAAGNAATTVTRTVNVTSVDPVFIEAETGTIGGSHNIANNHFGFTGSGFVDYVGEGYMEYTFEGNSVPYDLSIRYALGGGNRPLEVLLNGVSLGNVSFPATGGWTTWGSSAPLVVTPVSGTNTLRLRTTGSSGANVDSITLNPQ